MGIETPDTVAIRQRLGAFRLSQWTLANAVGVGQATLNQWLTNTRPMPSGMEARIHAALDVLERAERAAQEARERVLAEASEEEK